MTGQFADHDVWRFAQALIFNWLIVGTDAHAKNFSLILAGDQARLAPLYDLSSVLPHGGSPASVMSMRIGSTYRANAVTRDDWSRLAVGIGVREDEIFAEIARQATLLPALVTYVGQTLAAAGVGGSLPNRFAGAVSAWVPVAKRAIGL